VIALLLLCVAMLELLPGAPGDKVDPMMRSEWTDAPTHVFGAARFLELL